LLIEKIEINQEFYFKRLFINYIINAKKGKNILYIADYLKKHAKNYINSKKNKILLGKILNFTYAKRFF
ncbi:hypothetical protein, partial [Campylobacter volucris]|uniref:hypothetical protein n=1 Tax=Campylobacter volucris TaxID=1031542 RepID=UPI001E458A40